MFKSLVFLFPFSLVLTSVAQELTTVTEACPRTAIPFSAPTVPNAASYDWDFCTGDLLQTPKADIIESFINDPNTPQNDAWRPEGMDAAFDGTNWYGFITNRSGNNIIRVNFGNSLDNIPAPDDYKNLGNPGGLLSGAFGIKVNKSAGIWYAFVVNFSNGRITRLDFGINLDNNTPTGTNFQGLGIEFPEGIAIQKEADNYYLLITNFTNPGGGYIRRLSAVNFGTDLGNSSPTVIHTNFAFPLDWGDISTIKHQGNWYALVAGASATSNRTVLLQFGASLTNNPTAVNLNALIPASVGGIWGASFQQDGDKVVGYLQGGNGELLRLNFGTEITSNPQISNLTNFGVIGVSGLPVAFCIKKEYSKWFGLVINRNVNNTGTAFNNALIKISFEDLCNGVPSNSEVTNPTAQFLTSGTKNINLRVFDTDRNQIAVYTDAVSILDAVVGDFSFSNQCEGETVVFENLSQGNESGVISWAWDFGDGNTSNMRKPTHSYTNPGMYNVQLTVNNISGCNNTISKPLRISSRPIADFRIKAINCQTRIVEFEDLSDLPAEDKALGGEIRNRTWFFGDGTRWIASPFTATTYSKQYSTNGTYQINLTITDETGCSSTVTKSIVMDGNSAPVIDFSYTAPCVAVPVQFQDNSTIPTGFAGEVTDWQWTFFAPDGINVIGSSALSAPEFLFPATGTYPVKLSVRNSLGCVAQMQQNIVVNPSLSSQFEASVLNGIAPLTVKFTNQTVGANSFLWNFGNGEINTSESPTYTFTAVGIYIVQFQAKNTNGCGTIAARTIIVEEVTAQEDPIGKNLKIYPNPHKGTFFVQLENILIKDIQIDLLNVQGRLLRNYSLDNSSNEQPIDMQSYPAGMYVLQFKINGNIYRRKIIKH
jgi:PKD repeat protein